MILEELNPNPLANFFVTVGRQFLDFLSGIGEGFPAAVGVFPLVKNKGSHFDFLRFVCIDGDRRSDGIKSLHIFEEVIGFAKVPRPLSIIATQNQNQDPPRQLFGNGARVRAVGFLAGSLAIFSWDGLTAGSKGES